MREGWGGDREHERESEREKEGRKEKMYVENRVIKKLRFQRLYSILHFDLHLGTYDAKCTHDVNKRHSRKLKMF